MRTKKLFCMCFVLATGFFVSGTALAAKCSGTYSDVNVASEVIDLGDGHSLVIFTGRSTAASDNSPYTGTGLCGGYALTTPDGKTRVAYACVRKDANGDSWSDYGGMEPGSDVGTWNDSGGTGVFAGNVGGRGTWQPIATDGTTTIGQWSGNCR